jgi:hypothetical protein
LIGIQGANASKNTQRRKERPDEPSVQGGGGMATRQVAVAFANGIVIEGS